MPYAIGKANFQNQTKRPLSPELFPATFVLQKSMAAKVSKARHTIQPE